MLPYFREHFGNPSSIHAFGRRAREAVEVSRAEVASLLECAPDEIVFTSGGTEASNLAIRGIAEARNDRRHVVTSAIEHPGTEKPCDWLEEHGWRVSRAGVDSGGRVRIEDVRAAAGADTALVTILHANGETGVVQPTAEIADVAHSVGALAHCDAARRPSHSHGPGMRAGSDSAERQSPSMPTARPHRRREVLAPEARGVTSRE